MSVDTEAAAADSRDPLGVVFSPWLLLDLIIEPGSDSAEIHMHPGGQGFWIARLMAELGIDVTLVAPVGGEVGAAIGALAAAQGVRVKAVEGHISTGAVVYDGRQAPGRVLGEMPSQQLTR